MVLHRTHINTPYCYYYSCICTYMDTILHVFVCVCVCATDVCMCFDVVCEEYRIKPVLNWANVCSLNILRTLQRTMIRFLIELLVHRIWFGQSKFYFILNWLVMRCKLRPELAADSMLENIGSSQYTFMTPHRVIQLTTISFWVSETRLHLPQVNKFPPKLRRILPTRFAKKC